MDALNKWFTDQASTPVGSILMFALVFLVRVGIDQLSRRRTAKKRKAPKRTYLQDG